MNKILEMVKELLVEVEATVNSCECEGVSNKVKLSELEPGETFKIGDHDFIVLKQYESLEQTKVISKGFMAEDVVFGSSRDYNKSNLKDIIEKGIQPIIEKSVGAENLIEHEVDLISVDMQHEFDSFKCKIRPITFDEVREYNDLIVNEELDDWWWTCNPWSTEKRGFKYGMPVVSPSGRICSGSYNGSRGVRPVCILKSNIFVSKEDK